MAKADWRELGDALVDLQEKRATKATDELLARLKAFRLPS
jgi:hypothetical protein